jgi:hypothetical protein
MSCPSCGWPTAEAKVLSRHRTSEGVVYYLRCVCGQLTVRVLDSVVAPHGALFGGVD